MHCTKFPCCSKKSASWEQVLLGRAECGTQLSLKSLMRSMSYEICLDVFPLKNDDI